MKRDLSVDAKISVPERLSYTCGNIGNCIVLAIISMYMMYYYKDILHINAGMIATIMLISRVFDGVTDIFMGCVVDRTHSKEGKARVWLLRGAVPYILSVIGIFFVPSGASDMVKYIYIFVMYNLANAVFGTVVNTAYNSWKTG
ncbi:MFS transporter [Oribacterium sp. WCC10]|uniref:MFS transporter n=1 Tax=Oribacterium sp. WCC10 TaxID=1855343 RepID=UPI0008F36EF5|nr:MFS transporter [Oribacterium sp. WCC10]SFG36211.1 glycoside/pentoside/hexuronide:cation symporter, GPH family [Oribacterium sp. WCC10]